MMEKRSAILLLGVGLFVLAFILKPYWEYLFLGLLISLVLQPALGVLVKRGYKRPKAALFLTVTTVFMVLVPIGILVAIGTKSILRLATNINLSSEVFAQQFSAWMDQKLEIIYRLDLLKRDDMLSVLLDLGKIIGQNVASGLGSFAVGLPTVALGLLISALAIYFFIQEGGRLSVWIKNLLSPFFGTRVSLRVMEVVAILCRSVFTAALLSGFCQSIIFTLVDLLVGGKQLPAIGLCIFAFSFVPVIGAIPIMAFVVAWHYFEQGADVGFILLILTAALLSFLDQLVRTLVLRGKSQLHPFLAFLSLIGALKIFGFVGIFLGPILLGTALEFLRLGIGEVHVLTNKVDKTI